MNPEQYITDNNLWDIDRLKSHAQDNSVYVIESPQFLNVVMLHYQDSCTYSNTWNEFSRMSRGLILDMKNKKVLAFPYEKFYNLGQMPETSYDNLVALGGFQTSEKLDGSMIIMFRDPNTDKLTFTTKGSLSSEQGQYANQLEMPSGFWIVAARYMESGTLIFELISKRFQIVIDYPKRGYEEGLYLIGYRDHVSGKLASFNALEGIADELGVSIFKTYAFDSLDALIEASKGLPVTEEGYVLRFDSNDLMVKVKGPKYLEMHRFISNLSDRNILEAVANNTADTLVTLCPDEFQQEVLNKIDKFKIRFAEVVKTCYTYYKAAPKETRKIYAEWVNLNVEKYLRGFVFQLMDGKELNRKQIYKVIETVDCVDGRTKI
jgi:RNA ligase